MDGLDDTIIRTDEVAGLEGSRTTATEHSSLGVASDDGNLLDTLLLNSTTIHKLLWRRSLRASYLGFERKQSVVVLQQDDGLRS